MGSITSNPKVNVQLLPAAVVDAYADRRDLSCGQNGTVSEAADGALNSNVGAMTTAQIKTLFGTTSYLTNMILEWKATNGGNSPLDVIGVANAGTAGTCVVTIGGAPTIAGSFDISFVDDKKYKVNIPVVMLPVPDTPTTIADKITAAFGALTNDPCFTVDNLVGAVTATAVDLGTLCNDYGVKITGSVPGVTTTITTAWSNGATTPVVTDIFDVIDGIRYTGIIWPEDWYDSIAIVSAELESRFNADNAVLDGTCFTGMTNTYADIVSALSAENSQTIVTMGGPKQVLGTTPLQDGPAVMRPADWVCCEFLGIRSRRLTPGANIASYIVTTSGGLDAIGGPSLASLPYFNTPLRNTPVTGSAHLFTLEEQKSLEDLGYAAIGVNSVQNTMLTGPVVTNWVTDAGGNDNVSFHYLNYVDTGSTCREVFYSTLKSVFAQSRLTEGDLVPQRSMANAASIKAELLRIYTVLAGLTLTQAGREAESFFTTNTTVSVNLAQRSATIVSLLPIVTQLGTVNYSLQLSFTVGSTGTQITV